MGMVSNSSRVLFCRSRTMLPAERNAHHRTYSKAQTIAAMRHIQPSTWILRPSCALANTKENGTPRPKGANRNTVLKSQKMLCVCGRGPKWYSFHNNGSSVTGGAGEKRNTRNVRSGDIM